LLGRALKKNGKDNPQNYKRGKGQKRIRTEKKQQFITCD